MAAGAFPVRKEHRKYMERHIGGDRESPPFAIESEEKDS